MSTYKTLRRLFTVAVFVSVLCLCTCDDTIRQGYFAIASRNATAALNIAEAAITTSPGGLFPKAHRLAADACFALQSHCSNDQIQFHLMEAARELPSRSSLPDDSIENATAKIKSLPKKVRAQTLRDWLLVASLDNEEGLRSFLEVAKRAQTLEPRHSETQLLVASWVPRIISSTMDADFWFREYKHRMNALLTKARKKDSATKDQLSFKNVDDSLLQVAYALQFNHAYHHPPDRIREALELFGMVLRQGLISSNLTIDWAKDSAPKGQKEKKIIIHNTKSSNSPHRKHVCFVSTHFYGGHQINRIFNEVMRRLPQHGWTVTVAHVIMGGITWKTSRRNHDPSGSTRSGSAIDYAGGISNENGDANDLLLFDDHGRQRWASLSSNDGTTVLPLPRHKDQPLSAWLSHAREALRARQFDIVVFTDIGMDFPTYLLAHQRLVSDRKDARQLVAWGHPVTTGLPSVRDGGVIDAWVTHDAAMAGCWGSLALSREHQYEIKIEDDHNNYGSAFTKAVPSSSTASLACDIEANAIKMGTYFTEPLVRLPVGTDREWRRRHSQQDANGQLISTVTGRRVPTAVEVWTRILPMHHREGSTVENWKNLHLVVLLQAPQKIHPAFDEVLAAVTRADTRVRVAILGSLRKKSSNETREEDVDVPKDNGLDDKEQNDTPLIALQRRLAAAGVVEGALLFLDNFLPHEDLLGLFRTARVALDPLYFGGDGTSREALEMRCPVVTLPTGALGSRWTASLYQLLGLADGDVAKEGRSHLRDKFEVKPNLAPIAKNIDEYVQLVLRFVSGGNDKAHLHGGKDSATYDSDEFRRELDVRVPSLLFGRDDAVRAWADLLDRRIDI